MKNFFLLIVSFNIYSGFSQNEGFDYQTLRDELKVINENGDLLNVDEDVEGTPYLYEKFEKGKILQEDSKILDAYFRYNALKDIVEIKLNPSENEIFILPRSDKFIFKLTDYSYVYEDLITSEGEMLSGYNLRYYQGDNLLFVGKSNSKIKSAKVAETSYDVSTPSKIVNNINYYISFNGDPLIPVRIKEKDFRKLLPVSKEMKQYFEEYKIKEPEDVKKMLEFYETLSL